MVGVPAVSDLRMRLRSPIGFLPYMKAAEHFTHADPFRVNYTNANPNDIFPSQGTNGPIAASYNSA